MIDCLVGLTVVTHTKQSAYKIKQHDIVIQVAYIKTFWPDNNIPRNYDTLIPVKGGMLHYFMLLSLQIKVLSKL